MMQSIALNLYQYTNISDNTISSSLKDYHTKMLVIFLVLFFLFYPLSSSFVLCILSIDNIESSILNNSETPPYVLENRENVDEKLRLTYRFLDLRDPYLQNNLILRSKAMQIVRNYFASRSFFIYLY